MLRIIRTRFQTYTISMVLNFTRRSTISQISNLSFLYTRLLSRRAFSIRRILARSRRVLLISPRFRLIMANLNRRFKQNQFAFCRMTITTLSQLFTGRFLHMVLSPSLIRINMKVLTTRRQATLIDHKGTSHLATSQRMRPLTIFRTRNFIQIFGIRHRITCINQHKRVRTRFITIQMVLLRMNRLTGTNVTLLIIRSRQRLKRRALTIVAITRLTRSLINVLTINNIDSDNTDATRSRHNNRFFGRLLYGS